MFRCYLDSTRIANGSFMSSKSQNTTITIGFKPKYLVVSSGTSWVGVKIYDEDHSTTQFMDGTSSGGAWRNLGSTSNTTFYIYSINNNGFTMRPDSASSGTGRTWNYFAIG